MQLKTFLLILLGAQLLDAARPGHCDQPLPPTKQLQILLVADTSAPDIGNSVARDLIKLRQVLSWIQRGRENKIHIDVLQGDQVTPRNIVTYYASRKGQLWDVSLLFFYSGHGGLDLVEGQFLALQTGRLPRVSLVTAMENTGADLAVVLTNCCSNIPGVPPPNRDTGRTPAWDAFEQLFFQHRGLVDITAAEDGTFAWGNLFVDSFAELICDPIDLSDSHRDGFVEWEEFAPRLRESTNQSFQQIKQSLKDRAIERNHPHDLRDFSSQLPQVNLTGYHQASLAATYWHVRASCWEREAVPAMKSAKLLFEPEFAHFPLDSRKAILKDYARRVSLCYRNAVTCETRALQCLDAGSPEGVDQATCESKRTQYLRLERDWNRLSQQEPPRRDLRRTRAP